MGTPFDTTAGVSNTDILSKNPAQHAQSPVAALACLDLMFLVRLQGLARAAGFVPRTLRPGASPEGADVVVVNLGDRHNWLPLITEASSAQVPVVAFGPHLDAEGRKLAKAAGASRVLANSNLERDLPGILESARSLDTK